MTAWRRIQRTEKSLARAGTLANLYSSNIIHVLMLDAKHFRIRKKPFTLYVAFNAELMRPVAWILLPRHELRFGYDCLLGRLQHNNTRITGIVSDGHPGLIASVNDYYPDAIHQHCAFHVLADVLRKIGGRRLLASDVGRELWGKVRHIALGHMTLSEARKALALLKRIRPNHVRAWIALEKYLPGIYEFVKLPVLKDYRTSNRMENFMGVLEQRLKSFRSMKTPDTCMRIISSLIVEKYKVPTKK